MTENACPPTMMEPTRLEPVLLTAIVKPTRWCAPFECKNERCWPETRKPGVHTNPGFDAGLPLSPTQTRICLLPISLSGQLNPLESIDADLEGIGIGEGLKRASAGDVHEIGHIRPAPEFRSSVGDIL